MRYAISGQPDRSLCLGEGERDQGERKKEAIIVPRRQRQSAIDLEPVHTYDARYDRSRAKVAPIVDHLISGKDC